MHSNDEAGSPAEASTTGFVAAAPVEPDLIAGLIAAHDLAHGPSEAAVQVQLERTLRGAGIDRLLVAEGDLFDPAFHMVAATEAAPEPGLERRVAREVRAGWSSAGGVIRPAEVVVWTAG